jgi:hypothetical protein
LSSNGPPRTPDPSLLIASILGRDLATVDKAVAGFVEQFGDLAYLSEPLEFSWSDYYKDELGEHPARRFLALKRLVDPSELPQIKRRTARMEVAMARPGEAREVNIDPGVLNADQLVVASTKPRRHRIYMGRGIYADLMLLHGSNGFEAMPWTYPDYADPALRGLLGRFRGLYLAARRSENRR